MTPREARLAAGFTLAAAAEIIRVKPATYCDYERGHGRFSFRHAERLAKAFRASISDFATLSLSLGGDRNQPRRMKRHLYQRPVRHIDGAH